MIKRKLERTKETCTCNFETKKGENTLSMYDNKDKK